MSGDASDAVHRYHDGTKHHFNRYARSLGFLDWATQPKAFRAFDGAPIVGLYPRPDAQGASIGHPRVTYDQLFTDAPAPAVPITAAAIGDFLRHALGLSAWKAFQRSRWSLRVNPSSGNLHPTEAYLVTGALDGLAEGPCVWHYAPDRHVLEQRCAFDTSAWRLADERLAGAGGSTETCVGAMPPTFLIALTSIHWRESWKYGERAFRYCQHDLGHAIAALRFAAGLFGWRLTMRPEWSQRAIAALTGIDRDEDYFEAEREAPGCLLLVSVEGAALDARIPDAGLIHAVRNGRWSGKASQLSEDHVEWTFIDEVAAATSEVVQGIPSVSRDEGLRDDHGGDGRFEDRQLDARAIVLRRRSAVSLDGVSSIDRARFLRMLTRVVPDPARPIAPWDALWWSPRVHLALFVHRVVGLEPGLYMLARCADVVPRLKGACRRDFQWEPAADGVPLWLLQAGDYRLGSKRVSCDQDIAADGFFSLGMIAEFDASLAEHGASFYRHLFWESGVIGQLLYLEAEAAGTRATGIGCFFDDAVHELLGLEGHAFQSLYHFTVGMPVEDSRLTTEPGYAWEST